MKLMGNTSVMFVNNRGIDVGGAISIDQGTDVTIEGNSTLIFNENNVVGGGGGGGAIYGSGSTVMVKGNSTVKFSNNKGSFGGAINEAYGSIFIFSENSFIMFFDNKAGYHGGAMYIFKDTVLLLKGKSRVLFINSTAVGAYGGAIRTNINATIIIQENTSRTMQLTMKVELYV